MLEYNKIDTEEEYFRLLCNQDSQKDWRKSLRFSSKSLLKAAMVQKRLERSTRLLNDLTNRGNQILILFSMRRLSPLILSSTSRIIGPCRLAIMSLNTLECQQ